MHAANNFAAVQRVDLGELTTSLIRTATANASAPYDLRLRPDGHGFMREGPLQIEPCPMGQTFAYGESDSASAHILGCTNHVAHSRASHIILDLDE